MHIGLILFLYPGGTTHIDAHFQNRQLNKDSPPKEDSTTRPSSARRAATIRVWTENIFPLFWLNSPSSDVVEPIIYKTVSPPIRKHPPLEQPMSSLPFFLPSNFPGCCCLWDGHTFSFSSPNLKHPLQTIPSVLPLQSMRHHTYLNVVISHLDVVNVLMYFTCWHKSFLSCIGSISCFFRGSTG